MWLASFINTTEHILEWLIGEISMVTENSKHSFFFSGKIINRMADFVRFYKVKIVIWITLFHFFCAIKLCPYSKCFLACIPAKYKSEGQSYIQFIASFMELLLCLLISSKPFEFENKIVSIANKKITILKLNMNSHSVVRCPVEVGVWKQLVIEESTEKHWEISGISHLTIHRLKNHVIERRLPWNEHHRYVVSVQ
jgi:hypothetical protein